MYKVIYIYIYIYIPIYLSLIVLNLCLVSTSVLRPRGRCGSMLLEACVRCGAGCREPAACLNEHCMHVDCLYYIGLGKNGRSCSALPGSQLIE